MVEINDDILFTSVRELGKLIRSGKLSPVALADAYLRRLEKYGPKLGAVALLTPELARQQATLSEKELKAGNYRGPLHGIPCGIKDLFATKGLKTTWGAEPLKDQVFDYDAAVVEKLRSAGAVLVAKLAMIELAGAFGYNQADACWTGPCRTPWNLEYWAGGSSSGSGAAVAAGLVPFAIGTETSGSIITPAAYCGVTGLRPTYGRISRHGAMALSWTLDKIGPMCRTADDAGLVLQALAGRDPRDPHTFDRPFQWIEPRPRNDPGQRFKVGVIKNGLNGVQPEVARNFQEAVKIFKQFADVEEDVVYPELPHGPAVSTIVRGEGASAFRDLIESGKTNELRDPRDRAGAFSASMTLAVDYIDAQRQRHIIGEKLDELHARYDGLLVPGRDTVAPQIDRDFDKSWPTRGVGPAVIPASNLAGQPAICLPCGFGPKDLPTSIQIIGRVWSEDRLLRLAVAFQERTDWHQRRPTLANANE
jgi:aspartyl-tRNA(Asn)/glutamyl-tRNA(Gln) amidotransferase subunit A